MHVLVIYGTHVGLESQNNIFQYFEKVSSMHCTSTVGDKTNAQNNVSQDNGLEASCSTAEQFNDGMLNHSTVVQH